MSGFLEGAEQLSVGPGVSRVIKTVITCERLKWRGRGNFYVSVFAIISKDLRTVID